MKQSREGERGGDVTLCYTLVTISIRAPGALHTCTGHYGQWTRQIKVIRTSSSQVNDDTQNNNYQAFLSSSVIYQNPSLKLQESNRYY